MDCTPPYNMEAKKKKKKKKSTQPFPAFFIVITNLSTRA